jgi:hypothetical protein
LPARKVEACGTDGLQAKQGDARFSLIRSLPAGKVEACGTDGLQAKQGMHSFHCSIFGNYVVLLARKVEACGRDRLLGCRLNKEFLTLT